MAKRQSSKSDGTSTKKTDPTVLATIIGGIVTIIVALITVVVPLLLKAPEATSISPTTASNSQAVLATTPVSLISTNTPQLEITTTPATANDLVSMAKDNLNDVQVVHTETFDSFSEENWGPWSDSQSGGVEDGALKVTGLSNEDVGFTRINRPFMGGQGVILRFKYTSDSEDQAHFSFDFGETEVDWPFFGIYDSDSPNAAQVELNYSENNQPTQDLAGAPLKPGTWYNLLMVKDPKADLLAIIWDPGNLSHQIRYEKLDGISDWVNLSWFFEFSLSEGTSGSLYIDDFTEISFSSIK